MTASTRVPGTCAPGIRTEPALDIRAPRAPRARLATRAGRLGRLLIIGIVAFASAACGIATQQGTSNQQPAAVVPTPDLAAAGVRAQLAAALSARNLLLVDAKVPYRPGEPAELGSVARSVFQVQFRDDPTGGFILVYQLPSPELAAASASTLATWLSTGPGRVQAPNGTVHVIRQVGANVVYYRWLPGAAIDPETPRVQAALETVGIAVPVAR